MHQQIEDQVSGQLPWSMKGCLPAAQGFVEFRAARDAEV